MHTRNDTESTNLRDKNFLYSVLPITTGVIYNDSQNSTNVAIDEETPEHKASNQAVSVLTAGIRAIAYQIQSLYLRSPVKLFRPSRFDYMAYVRALANRHNNISEKPYKFHTHSSIGMLVSVLRKEGWKFIPDQVMPPLIANSATGVILYATYLNALDRLTSKRGTNRNTDFNWYSPIDTWRAGFVAGAVQSLAAAPVDAIYTRSSVSEMIEGSHENLWKFGINKLKEIGLVGVFAGYSFSLIKESIGFAFYFSTFETIKTQGYSITYKIFKFFRDQEEMIKSKLQSLFSWDDVKVDEKMQRLERYRSERLLKTSFILIAGASAAFALLAVQYPLTKVQKIHLSRLEALDIYSASTRKEKPFIKLYYNSYIDTFNQVLRMKQKAKVTWFKAAYSGFIRNAVTTIPATSVALLVFEITRTRLVSSMEEPEILAP